MRTPPILIFLFAVIIRFGMAQETASLSGFVIDETNGETLILANVVIEGTALGVATNTAGFYTFPKLLPGTYRVLFSYIGFQHQTAEVTLNAGQNLRLDVELHPEDLIVGEVVVTAEQDQQKEDRRIGIVALPTETIRRLPTVLEPDVFRSLQLLPGVKAASDYSSGLYIRGGTPDQTLILLDRTTVYNPTHFFGFFSTFNPDAIKDVRLYKGAYPAEYGGRLGSVIDIYNKDGNRRKTAGDVSVGLLASRAVAEGPYQKGSWMLAVRRSTIDPILAMLRKQDIDGIPDAFYFYDLNGKVNLDATKNDRLSVSFYAGQDALDLSFLEDARIKLIYGNRTLNANWTRLFSHSLFGNFSFTSSQYFNTPKYFIGGTEFNRDNDVFDLSLRGDLQYIPDQMHAFTMGFWSGNFTMKIKDMFDGQETLNKRIQTVYTSVYVEETYRPTSLSEIKGGLRLNYFDKGRYLRIEPRMSFEYSPQANIRLQLAYGRYYQFLTLISSELFSGFDLWLTTADGVPPAYGDQFVGGVKTRLSKNVNLDVETYYRTMSDLFILDPALPDAAGLQYRDLFLFGGGYAYGTEVTLQRTRGRLNGFIGYTFGITRRKFDTFENGKRFAPKYDRRHDLKIVANYNFSKKWQASAVFTFATGQAYTEPVSQYKLLDNPFGSALKEAFVTGFNEFRLPPYHRLDIGFSRFGSFFGLAESELQLQVINVYKRKNVWFYAFDFEDDNTVTRDEIPQIPVPIPNVSYTIRF